MKKELDIVSRWTVNPKVYLLPEGKHENYEITQEQESNFHMADDFFSSLLLEIHLN